MSKPRFFLTYPSGYLRSFDNSAMKCDHGTAKKESLARRDSNAGFFFGYERFTIYKSKLLV